MKNKQVHPQVFMYERKQLRFNNQVFLFLNIRVT